MLQKIDSSYPVTDTRKILIKHRLTAYNSHLLREANKVKTERSYSFVWFQECVLLKKTPTSAIVRIRCEEDLRKASESVSVATTSSS